MEFVLSGQPYQYRICSFPKKLLFLQEVIMQIIRNYERARVNKINFYKLQSPLMVISSMRDVKEVLEI